MARIKLTAGRIREFATDKGQAFLWDAETPGLAVRATPAGKRNTEGCKSYVLQSTLASGKEVRVTIGDVRAWSIDDARKEARRLQGLIDQGIDPRQEKRERMSEAAAKVVAANHADTPAMEAWRAYITARTPKWGARHLASHLGATSEGGKPYTRGSRTGKPNVTQSGALLPLLLLPLNQIDADRVGAWLRDETAKRPTHAGLMFRLLRAFLNWCEFHPDHRGQVRKDACAGRIARDILPKMVPRADNLQREQLPAWFTAVRQIRNPVISAYLQCLLLTGARREEMAGVRWVDVDFQWNSLTIRDKMEGERIIPLTPYVSSLMASLPRRNAWVFSSPSSLSDLWLQHIDLFENIKFGTNLFHIKINWLHEESDRLLERHPAGCKNPA